MIFSLFFVLFRALLPDLAEDLVQKAIDPIFPADTSDDLCDSCQPENKMPEIPKRFFMII